MSATRALHKHPITNAPAFPAPCLQVQPLGHNMGLFLNLGPNSSHPDRGSSSMKLVVIHDSCSCAHAHEHALISPLVRVKEAPPHYPYSVVAKLISAMGIFCTQNHDKNGYWIPVHLVELSSYIVAHRRDHAFPPPCLWADRQLSETLPQPAFSYACSPARSCWSRS